MPEDSDSDPLARKLARHEPITDEKLTCDVATFTKPPAHLHVGLTFRLKGMTVYTLQGSIPLSVYVGATEYTLSKEAYAIVDKMLAQGEARDMKVSPAPQAIVDMRNDLAETVRARLLAGPQKPAPLDPPPREPEHYGNGTGPVLIALLIAAIGAAIFLTGYMLGRGS